MAKISRRTLIQGTVGAATLVPLAILFANAAALAKNPSLDPGDATAKALGYETASAKPDEKCANCSLFQGKSGDASGGCTAFPGKDVVAGGYCKAWAKKA